MKRRRLLFLIISLFCLALFSVLFYLYIQGRRYFEGRFYRIPAELSIEALQTEEDREFTDKFGAYSEHEILQWLRKKTLGDIVGESNLSRLRESAIEVGPHQYPGLYRRIELCAEILHMEPPRTFVKADPSMDAEVSNTDSPTLVITSGMLETLSPGEMQFVLGHQLGHIRFNHILPKTIAGGIIDALKHLLPERIASLAVPASCYALMRWTKDAEISADRAGLICCQQENTAIQALMRTLSGLSADSSRKYGSPDVESFVTKRKEHEQKALLNMGQILGELDKSAGCRSYAGTRVIEIRDYARSPEYRDIFRKNE